MQIAATGTRTSKHKRNPGSFQLQREGQPSALSGRRTPGASAASNQTYARASHCPACSRVSGRGRRPRRARPVEGILTAHDDVAVTLGGWQRELKPGERVERRLEASGGVAGCPFLEVGACRTSRSPSHPRPPRGFFGRRRRGRGPDRSPGFASAPRRRHRTDR